MDLVRAHAVHEYGDGEPVVVLGHGIASDQAAWDAVVDHFRGSARLVTFSLAGSPDADPALFSPQRHASLLGFADDVSMLCAQLGLRNAVYVGHSLSGMAGALAAAADPGLFSRLVLVCASARYVDDEADGYVGGFTQEEIDGLLAAIAGDFEAWSAGFAPVVMANPDRPEFTVEFVRLLRALGPEMAAVVFRAAFTSDFRAVMPRVSPPTLLVQSSVDAAVPLAAAQWLAQALPDARLHVVQAQGHFPHVVAPGEVIAAIEEFGLDG